MRAYFFGNMYLSSIQQGIQAAHVVADMFLKYPRESQQYAILEHWAREHKTMVLLNAGYSEEIRSLLEFFSASENPLPWQVFYEGKDALDGAITCIGIILPEEFYGAAREIKELGVSTPSYFRLDSNFVKLQSEWERLLAQRLNNYGLAR